MSTSFEALGLDQVLVTALKQEKILVPTAIQVQTIPLILENRDVVGQSETGTGKTLAYLLPIIQRIELEKRETQALILCPTHELAIQIEKEIEILARNSGLNITSMAVIGNINITRQIEKLKEKRQIIVGSGGRILELIQKKKISAQSIKTIVLDEADRLLDEHNYPTVKAVLKTTLKTAQLLMFSATLPPVTLPIVSELLKSPEVIRITDKVMIASTITHLYFLAEQRDKIEVLRKLIRLVLPTRALIFINKSEEIEKMVEKLKYHGLKAEGIYGSAHKNDRRKALNDFRSGKVNLLVASDLAARGLDIRGVTHIFNLDLPEDPLLYLHRAGRTGRSGESGLAISLVNAKELNIIKRLESAFEIVVCPKELVLGNISDPKKKTATMRKREN